MANKQTAEKLTAMEQLIHWIDSDCTPMDCIMKAKELLAMEKEQIIDAYADGVARHLHEKVILSEQYYEETNGTQLPKE